jgi:hypothetical protein
MGARMKFLAAAGGAVVALTGTLSVGVRMVNAAGPSDNVEFMGSTTMLTCMANNPPNEAPEEAPEPAAADDPLAFILDTAFDPNDDNPPMNCPANGQGIPLEGGWGNYSFTTSQCEITSTVDVPDALPDVNPNSDPGPLGCSFTSAGSYENLDCSIGEAWGGAFNFTTTGGLEDAKVNDYTIFFFGGIGIVSGHVTENDAEPAGSKSTLDGAVSLTVGPPLPPAGSNLCATNLNITGDLSITD